MEAKLEVGMHAYSIQDRKYGIGNIVKIDDKRTHSEVLIKIGKGLLRTRTDCVKTSYDILDLIEVGDYVNGCKVTSIEENGLLGFDNHDWYLRSEEIKSIVTKEQFSQMEYRIGE